MNQRKILTFLPVLLGIVISVSIAFGYLIGSQSANASVYFQKHSSTQNAQVTNDKNINRNETQSGSQPVKESDSLTDMKEYNKSLLDTVYMSLLGTVSTIALGFLGIQFFVNTLSSEQQKQTLIKELEPFILNKIIQISEKQINLIDIKIKWLEYQIAVLSSEQLEMQGESQYPAILQERIRAIKVLMKLENQGQGSSVNKCVSNEIKAIKEIGKNLDSYNHKDLPNLISEQVKSLQKQIDKIRYDYSKYNDDFDEILNLYSKYK